jgi:hypothetical protein
MELRTNIGKEMCHMKMPGFTAEASLYQTSEVYEHSMVWISSADGQEVMPQAPPQYGWSYAEDYPPITKALCQYGDCLPYGTVDQYGDWKFEGWYKEYCCFHRIGGRRCKLISCQPRG